MSTNTVTNSTLSAARKRDEMLEPYEWKRSRTVLRREGASNRPDLVDYAPLVKRLGGQVVKISPTSTQYVNPMDINLNYSDDDNPLALKVDFLLSFCDIVVGSKDGLQPVEKTVIDRCVRNVYRPYLADPDPARMPILQDLYDELLAQPETEAQRIAAALENGDSLELVLGATELTVTQGGRITTLDMGAAPFVRDGHTYIPVRAAAEALGLDVYWDDTYEAAHLTDYAALTAELDSRFTAANGIWAAIRDTIPREAGKGYESTASMRLSATLYGEEEHDTASLTMEVKQLTRDGSYRMEQEQQVDLGGLGDTLFAGLSPEELAQLENHSVTLYDRESGTLYQKGVQLYSLEGEPLPDDVWVSTQVGELPAVNTLSLPGTLGELLVEAYGHSWYYYRSSPWETVMDSALPVRLLLDDGNFTRSASGGRTTYRWAVDLPALLERARMLGVMEDAPAVEGLPALDMHGEAVLRGGALEKLDGSGQMELDVLGIPADAGFTLDAAPGRLELEMEFTGAYIGKVELSLNGRVTETAAQPVTTPPAGETVERLEVLSGQVEPGPPISARPAMSSACWMPDWGVGMTRSF